MEELNELKIVYKKLDELVVPDYNPRKINAKQKEEIKRSLLAFGFVQPLVVNVNEERKNIIVGGNQRYKIAQDMGLEVAPCVEVNLNEAEEKELNLRLNKNQAEFDFAALNQYFNRDMLFDVGFTDKEIGKSLSSFDKAFAAIDVNQAPMPIVPKFNEKYGCVIITFKSELDETFLLNYLHLNKAKDYKNSRMGTPYVIDVADFQKIIAPESNYDEADE